MCLLFKLSKYSVVPILSDWLGLIELVQFDSALSNQELHWLLLKLCWEFSGVFQNSYFRNYRVVLSAGCNKWLEKRRFNAVSAEVTLPFLQPFKTNYVSTIFWSLIDRKDPRVALRSTMRRVVNLKLSAKLLEKHATLLAEVLSHCCNLNELIIESDKAFRSFSLPVQKDLPCKVLRFNMIYDIRFFLPLVRACSNLVELHMDSFCHQDYKLATAVVVWCRHLVCFNVAMRERRDQFILAFHAGRMFNTQHVTKGSELLLKTLLHYRGGDKLTALTIEKFPLSAPHTLPQTIASVSPNVADLTLSQWPKIDAPLVQNLSLNFFQLKRVCLNKCYQIDTDAVPLLFDSSFPLATLKTGEHFPALELLRINSFCRVETLDFSFNKHLTDECLIVLGKYCPLITDLNVSFCSNITDEGIRAIIRNRRLTKLKMSSKSLTDATLANLSTYCFDLHSLNIAYLRTLLSLEAVLRLIMKCRALQYLTCSVTGDELKRVKEVAKMHNASLKIVEVVENVGVVSLM